MAQHRYHHFPLFYSPPACCFLLQISTLFISFFTRCIPSGTRYHPLSQDPAAQLAGSRPLPPPLVADLNGDGHLEVIVATAEGAIQVVKTHPPGYQGDGFAPTEVLAQVRAGYPPAPAKTESPPARRRLPTGAPITCLMRALLVIRVVQGVLVSAAFWYR